MHYISELTTRSLIGAIGTIRNAIAPGRFWNTVPVLTRKLLGRTSSGTGTAVFVSAVGTVLEPVALPVQRNTFSVSTLEPVMRAGGWSGWSGRRASLLIRVIYAVVISIATPHIGDTITIFAHEVSFLIARSCKKSTLITVM